MMIKENGLLTVVVLLMMPVLLMANPVGKDEARQKAMSFISERRPAMARGTQLEQDLKVELSNESYHVFNLGSNDGFVIVSGDDCADDILGYADSGTFDAENMPDNLKAKCSCREVFVSTRFSNNIRPNIPKRPKPSALPSTCLTILEKSSVFANSY